MRAYPIIYRLHKIFSIVVGIQLLIWVVSGLYMTAVPITYVHGDHLRVKPETEMIATSDLPKLLADVLIERNIYQIESLRLFSRLQEPVYQAKFSNSQLLIHGLTGEILDNLTAEQASQIAFEMYTGDASVKSVREIKSYTEMPEIKGRQLPIWQVNFDDWVSTSLYVSNTEAQVITARSSIWRIFDFFWMLHIMDYDEREDFNNPLVIFMASAGILMVLSGAILLLKGLQRLGIKYLN